MKGVQYTIRGVPEEVDTKLREEAAQFGKSLNTLLIEKLSGPAQREAKPWTNGLEAFAGTWIEDPSFDEAMEAHEIVHPEEWE